MKYWLIALPKANTDQVLELGVFGRKSPQKFQHGSEGDKLAFYVTREYEIEALGEVTKPYYLSEKRIFLDKSNSFPHRIDFTAGRLDEPIQFRTLIEKLSFIKKPEFWHAYIRRGFAEMSEKDWRTITKAAGTG